MCKNPKYSQIFNWNRSVYCLIYREANSRESNRIREREKRCWTQQVCFCKMRARRRWWSWNGIGRGRQRGSRYCSSISHGPRPHSQLGEQRLLQPQVIFLRAEDGARDPHPEAAWEAAEGGGAIQWFLCTYVPRKDCPEIPITRPVTLCLHDS